MNGWQTALALALAFGGGYAVASWVELTRNEKVLVQLFRRLVALENEVREAKS